MARRWKPSIPTARIGPGVYQLRRLAGPHQYALRTLSSAPVRLFGWVAQNHAGVTYETLGINGAQANLMLEWNPAILAPELMSRDPALIVLAYGTNEALSRAWTAEEYRAGFDRNHPAPARRGSGGEHSADRSAGLRVPHRAAAVCRFRIWTR